MVTWYTATKLTILIDSFQNDSPETNVLYILKFKMFVADIDFF